MCEECGTPDAVCTVAEFNLFFVTVYLARTALDAQCLCPCTQTHNSHHLILMGYHDCWLHHYHARMHADANTHRRLFSSRADICVIIHRRHVI
jgi:hypothetical protein